MTEVRYGHLILVTDRTGNVVSSDAERVVEAFGKHQFKFGRKHYLGSAEELYNAIYRITNMGEGLHLIYIIAKVSNSKIVDGYGEKIRVRSICKILDNTEARKIVMLQLNLPRTDHLEGSGRSHGNGLGKSCKPKLKLLNHPTDMLLAYLPRFEHHDVSVVDHLCKELTCSQNFDELLAFLTRSANKSGTREIPSYTSTMRRRVNLFPETHPQGRHRVISGGKAFAFLVERFGEARRSGVVARDINAGADVRNIDSAFRELRCEVECQRGKIDADFILKSVERIADDQRNRPSPILAIVISSHGIRGGMILCSDKSFHVRDLLCRLEGLEKVPKLILVQSRRGRGNDWSDSASIPFRGPEEKIGLHLPLNTLLVMATSDGNKSYFSDEAGSNIIRELCGNIHLSVNNKDGDVFDILHDVSNEVSSKTIPDIFWHGAKQQLTFASSLTKPLRFSNALQT